MSKKNALNNRTTKGHDLKHSLMYDPIWHTNSTCARHRLDLCDQHMCCWYTKWGHNINNHDPLFYMTPFGVPTAHVLGIDCNYVTSTCGVGTQSGVIYKRKT